MSRFYEDLDHASKVPFDEFIRIHSQVRFNSITRRTYLWINWSVRAFGKTLIFLFSREEFKDTHRYKEFEWVLINDHNGHSAQLMDGLIESFTNLSSIIFLTCNRDLLTPTSEVKFKKNSFRSISLSSLWNSIVYSISRYERFSGLGFWALPALLTHIFDCSRILEACKYYEKVEFSQDAKLICLCDSHWHQSVVTSVFNRRKMLTFTCMHGLPSKWEVLSPFNSRYILSWGDRMSAAILKYCDDITPDRIISIGNSKYKDLSERSLLQPKNFDEIKEFVFISSCYNCSDTYGLEGLREELTKFLELSFPGVSLAIRPYPYDEEIRFIEGLLRDMELDKKVAVLKNTSFDELITPNRLFIGSISSATGDVIIKGGFFIGLDELLSRDLLERNICYSPDIYFNMQELELFLNKLKDNKTFHDHLNRLTSLRDGLVGPEIKSLERHILNSIG